MSTQSEEEWNSALIAAHESGHTALFERLEAAHAYDVAFMIRFAASSGDISLLVRIFYDNPRWVTHEGKDQMHYVVHCALQRDHFKTAAFLESNGVMYDSDNFGFYAVDQREYSTEAVLWLFSESTSFDPTKEMVIDVGKKFHARAHAERDRSLFDTIMGLFNLLKAEGKLS